MSLAYWNATDGIGVREKIEMEVMKKNEGGSRQDYALGDKTKQSNRRERRFEKSHCIRWHLTNYMRVKKNKREREREREREWGRGKNAV